MTEFPMSGVGSSDCVHPSDCAWLQTVKSRMTIMITGHALIAVTIFAVS
jgi:hypothetical protein